MTLTQVTIFIVICGIALLLRSLKPIKKICAYEDQKDHGWGQLYYLIWLFISGYVMFGYYVLIKEVGYIELITATLFFGAGWFLLMTGNLSLNSIKRIDKIVKVERYRALHDPLTGIANRTLFYERINHALALAKREENEIALMMIDLNEFKEVNDTLGHQTGDTLLKQASQRLKELLRESDTLARFGGDEFAVILPQTTQAQAHALAERLTNAIHTPFTIDNRSLTIGMSVGISMYPQHASDSNALIKLADIAMYSAKRYQKGFLLFENKMHDELNLDVDIKLISSASTRKQQATANKNRVLN